MCGVDEKTMICDCGCGIPILYARNWHGSMRYNREKKKDQTYFEWTEEQEFLGAHELNDQQTKSRKRI